MSPNSATDCDPARVRSVGRAALSRRGRRGSGVLRLQRARDVGRREVAGLQARGSSQTLICRSRPPITTTWPTPLDAFELAAQHLVRVLGDLADRLLRRERDRQHRRASGSNFSTVGWSIVLRQQRQDAVDAVAHFLRGDVGVLLEQERDDDLRDALRRGRAQLVDAADRVDRFLDLVGDLGLDFLRRGAGQPRRDDDGREVDLREAIETEAGRTRTLRPR